MGAFRDSGVGAGAGLGNFLKSRIQVQRDSAIKKLLKIFLFIYFIYAKHASISNNNRKLI